jgi:deoxyuridine 5'-triphosphate nucleotidohydrolase
VAKVRAGNSGKIVCLPCSRFTKSSGRLDPNARYAVDDGFLAVIDTDLKAYLLGWIASVGAIQPGTIAIYVHSKDEETLRALRDALCARLPIKKKNKQLVGFALSSRAIVSDVCRWLKIAPGKKDAIVSFPELANDDLKWAFLRGYFDGDGSVTSLATARGLSPYPRCSIASTSESMLHAIESFCSIPCHRGPRHLEWSGNNALDFMARLYDGAPLSLRRKRDLYLDWSTWVPGLGGGGKHGRELRFRWVKCLAEGRPPTKAHASDSGYDLTLVQAAHRTGRVQFFRTGVKVQPSYGWYFDLVPRSSISKTGYMLANSIGIIDRAYVGEILVPLLKIDDGAPDLALPARIVQIVPRPIVHAEFVEVASLEESGRGTGGFGSTDVRRRAD